MTTSLTCGTWTCTWDDGWPCGSPGPCTGGGGAGIHAMGLEVAASGFGFVTAEAIRRTGR